MQSINREYNNTKQRKVIEDSEFPPKLYYVHPQNVQWTYGYKMN